MSARQYNKYLWLLHTVHAAGETGITFSEIEEAWVHCPLNDHHESRLPRQTFNDWKREVSELIGREILCYPHSYRYYVPSYEHAVRLSPEQRAHLEAAEQIWAPFTSPLYEEQIRIRTLNETARNLRAFPLNDSQRELRGVSDRYCEFEFLMSPNIRLFYQLRSLGSEIEVLQPLWIRELMWDEAITQSMVYSEGLTIDEDASAVDTDIYGDIDARKGRFETVDGKQQHVLFRRLIQEDFEAILRNPERYNVHVDCWDRNRRFYLQEDGTPISYDVVRISSGLGQNQRFAYVEIVATHVETVTDGGITRPRIFYDLGRVLKA